MKRQSNFPRLRPTLAEKVLLRSTVKVNNFQDHHRFTKDQRFALKFGEVDELDQVCGCI